MKTKERFVILVSLLFLNINCAITSCYSQNITFIAKYGSQSTLPSGFNSPTSFAIDDNNHIYVVDGDIIKVLTIAGMNIGYSSQFGGTGTTNGFFKSPNGLTVKKGKILISDVGNKRLQIITTNGINYGYSSSYLFPNSKEYTKVEFDSSGTRIFACNPSYQTVDMLELNGKTISFVNSFDFASLGNISFFAPRAVSIGNSNHVYVSTQYVVVNLTFDGTNFGKKNQIGLSLPKWGLAVTKNESAIFVSDNNNYKIVMLTSDGSNFTQATTFGSYGTSDGQFNYPTEIKADSMNRLYILDPSNFKLQVFQIGASKTIITNLEDIETYTKFSDGLNISPSPSSTGIFNIKNLDESRFLGIHNAKGEFIKINIDKNQQIDLSNFPKGVYFVHILNKQNEKQTIKILSN